MDNYNDNKNHERGQIKSLELKLNGIDWNKNKSLLLTEISKKQTAGLEHG